MNPKNDEPTQIISIDIDKTMEMLMNFEIKPRICFKCSKQFFQNYHDMSCDECYFAQFPKDQVKKFYSRFFE